jgi:hypothetical protein
MYLKKAGKKNRRPYPKIDNKDNFFFCSTTFIIAAKANSSISSEITSVEEEDMKKGYCEQPAIKTIMLFSEFGKPDLLTNIFKAITKRIVAKMSKARIALYSSKLKIFRNGINATVRPGGEIQYVSNTGVVRSVVKYFITPIPLPASKFSAYVI